MKQITVLLAIALLCYVNNSSAQQIPRHCIAVKHTYYELFYDTLIKGPIYGFYIQTKPHTKEIEDRKKFGSFHQDPLIPAKYQIATNIEYSSWNAHHSTDGKKRDKGHLDPYTAFAFNETAASESMYYTNTAPQVSFFNEHQWERVEQYVLKTVCPQFGDVKVYTGVIYGNKMMNDVHEPDFYWKIIYYVKNGKQVGEAWLGKNDESNTSTNPAGIVSTVAIIEQKTGLQFN